MRSLPMISQDAESDPFERTAAQRARALIMDGNNLFEPAHAESVRVAAGLIYPAGELEIFEVVNPQLVSRADYLCFALNHAAGRYATQWRDSEEPSVREIAKALQAISTRAESLLQAMCYTESMGLPDDIVRPLIHGFPLVAFDGFPPVEEVPAMPSLGMGPTFNFRLDEKLQAIARDIALVRKAATDQAALFSQHVPQGRGGPRREMNPGVRALLCELCLAYERTFDRAARTSVDVESGVAGGPLLKFCSAALNVLGVQLGPDAIRSRIRSLT